MTTSSTVDGPEALHLYQLLLGQAEERRKKMLVRLENFSKFDEPAVPHVQLAVHSECLAGNLDPIALQLAGVDTAGQE